MEVKERQSLEQALVAHARDDCLYKQGWSPFAPTRRATMAVHAIENGSVSPLFQAFSTIERSQSTRVNGALGLEAAVRSLHYYPRVHS